MESAFVKPKVYLEFQHKHILKHKFTQTSQFELQYFKKSC